MKIEGKINGVTEKIKAGKEARCSVSIKGAIWDGEEARCTISLNISNVHPGDMEWLAAEIGVDKDLKVLANRSFPVTVEIKTAQTTL
ncbi:MAG: hypothetical protein PHZ19_09910 [Candidatus Thermoplasmatota archaeon]|nr:hypothetical protein [Candidatus Thermoplasmatota archaeon]